MKVSVFLCSIVLLALIAVGCKKPAAETKKPSPPAPAKTEVKKTVPAAKAVPVPENWIAMVDEEKGYGFKVPEGTQRQTENVNGVDVFLAKTPEPSSVAVIVVAFKDKTLSKSDLLKYAAGFLEGMKEHDIKIGEPIELSDDYSLAPISSVDEKGKITKGKVLVATDVTDNYVVLLGTDESEYKENEKIMDEIWGSFSMRSGGYTGKS